MKPLPRQLLTRVAAALASLYFVCGPGISSVRAQEIDIYVGYSGKGKKAKAQLLEALPSTLKVKDYNVDVLALADYSGKQKVVTKFERARLIILLGDRPMNILKGIALKKDLLIVNSSKSGVSSSSWMAHVVGADVDADKLEGKLLKVLKEEDLGDAEAIKSAGIIKVEKLDIFKATALIAQKVLGN